MIIKYCDRCKFNTQQCSKLIPDGETENTIKECPECGYELETIGSLDDIP